MYVESVSASPEPRKAKQSKAALIMQKKQSNEVKAHTRKESMISNLSQEVS